jgi:hypothetical protein
MVTRCLGLSDVDPLGQARWRFLVMVSVPCGLSSIAKLNNTSEPEYNTWGHLGVTLRGNQALHMLEM